MKPFRGKRTGPQSPSRGFSLPAGGDRSRLSPLGEGAGGRGLLAAGALSRVGAPRPVRRRSETVGQGDPRLGADVTGSARSGPPADRGRPSAAPRLIGPCGARTTDGDWFQCSSTARVGAARVRARSSGSVANRSAARPTRLETRTKESNMCASRRALRNPKA